MSGDRIILLYDFNKKWVKRHVRSHLCPGDHTEKENTTGDIYNKDTESKNTKENTKIIANTNNCNKIEE